MTKVKWTSASRVDGPLCIDGHALVTQVIDFIMPAIFLVRSIIPPCEEGSCPV